MNNIHAEQQRYAQTALFYSYALHLADRFNSLEVEQSAYPTPAYIFRHVALACRTGHDVAGHRQVELPKFLLECHLCHQAVDIHAHLRILAGCVLMPAARRNNEHRNAQTGYKRKRVLHIIDLLFCRKMISQRYEKKCIFANIPAEKLYVCAFLSNRRL